MTESKIHCYQTSPWLPARPVFGSSSEVKKRFPSLSRGVMASGIGSACTTWALGEIRYIPGAYSSLIQNLFTREFRFIVVELRLHSRSIRVCNDSFYVEHQAVIRTWNNWQWTGECSRIGEVANAFGVQSASRLLSVELKYSLLVLKRKSLLSRRVIQILWVIVWSQNEVNFMMAGLIIDCSVAGRSQTPVSGVSPRS